MSKLISGSVDYDLAPLERVMMNWMRDRVPVKFPPIPMIDVVKGKDLKSSVGMPWKFYFADYGCMVAEFGYEEIAQMVEELEESIIQGKPYTTLFYLFSKLDKYTSSKINKRGFRSIQVADVFLLFIMQKYFAQMVKELEMAAIQMFLVTDVDSYAMRMQSHRNRHSFGVDFSAYDKTESSDLMRMSFRLLCSRVVIPSQVASFIEEAICCPVYILPVEETPIYGSGGSNPSGQFLTSVMNTLNHIIMNAVCVHEALGVPFERYLDNNSGVARMTGTGDDGVESFSTEKDARTMMKAFPELLYSIFGVTAKIDGWLDDDGNVNPYPPGVLPPYLSSVEWEMPGGSVVIPSRPTRSLATLQFENPADAKKDGLYEEKLLGVSVSMSGFDNILYGDPTYPIPQAYYDLREVMVDYNVPVLNKPWDRMRTMIDPYHMEEHCGCNRNIALMKRQNQKKQNKQIATGIANIVANKVAATVNKKKKKRNRRKTRKPNSRSSRRRQTPMIHHHISKLYMDPEGKTRPPVTDQSYGNMTPVAGVQRLAISSSTTQDTYLIFQWTPTEIRGVYVVNDGTWNVGTIGIPQLSSNPPYGIRPLRMSVEICNTTSYVNAVGQVMVAMSPQQVVWKSLLHTDGLHFTSSGISDLSSFISSFVKTQVYSAADFISPKKWVHYPVSSVGYHEWLTYGNSNYTGNGYLSYLVPGADTDALSTMMVKLASTSAINNYVFTVRVQEACRYPLNTVLGNIGVHQERASAAVIQDIHRSAADTGHVPVKGGAGGTSDYSIMPIVTKYADQGTDMLKSLGGFAGTAYNFGRGVKSIWDTLTAAAPLVEEIGPGLLALA